MMIVMGPGVRNRLSVSAPRVLFFIGNSPRALVDRNPQLGGPNAFNPMTRNSDPKGRYLGYDWGRNSAGRHVCRRRHEVDLKP